MKNKIIQPLSAGFCATVLAIAGSVTANVAASAVLPSKAFALASTSNGSEPDSQLPPVRETLSEEDAKNLPGCEAYFDSAKHEFVIRPKNGANEGVISYSLDNKKADFEAIRQVLIFKGDSDEVPVRFDKRVYIYDSTDATANDTLFYQIHVKTINITDNLNIKFAKNLAKFFMQDYRKSADHLNYIKGVENWDTSHVESMEKMFNLASQLEGKLDLSKWDVSGADKLNLMFSGVGNDSFVLDFSNKKFKNSADVTNMFNSFRGVLVANNWTVADPSGDNPIQKLVDNSSWMLTHWDASAHAYIGPSYHLLITDNPTILTKNQTAKYKFYKKVKVIYKINGTEKSVELELPAVYDSRIDENGKPDVSKAASSDPMKVIKPQIKEAIQKAITQLRTENPSLNLPQNVIPVPVKEILDSDSPAALFQDYYLGLVKEETVKAKTTYKADTNLEYKKVEYDTQPQDGKKQVITGAMKDGAWDPDATSEKEITKVVNGVARVGNQTTTVTVLEPGITYVADGNLAYNTTETQSEGVKGTSTSIDTYEVNSETGLTNTLDHHDMRIKKATNKVVKVGNKEVKTEEIQPGTTYEADSSLDYQAQSETAGESGTKSVTKVYKVDPTSGLTAELDGTPTETTTKAAKNKVIKVGNKQVTTETIEPGTTYEADSSLDYQAQSETAGEAGTKSVTKVYKVNKDTGLTTELDGTPTEAITNAAKNKVIKVGNKQVTTETIEPGATYQADSSLEYNKTSETAGEAGTKSVTKVYKVNKDTGLTTELDGTPTEAITKAAKNKVIKVGNVKTENKVIKFTTEEINDPTLPEGQTQTTEGKDGSEKLVTTYEVNSNTGLTDKVLKTETK
ncbi:BspA family leucine-rich repeat surface protein, partial [Gardnerella vaginalis]|uniref:BspA family leucine-rich repeat surface protein n=1 Tax=Gardnerella vaginalis TaxID=2702 RepID=UPI00197AFD21